MKTSAEKLPPAEEPQTVVVGGQRFVLVEEAEYRRLKAKEYGLPLPPADERGTRPARETLAVLLARDIIRQRKALGLSQAELARRAGVRQETLNRIEQGKHAASLPTVDKIDRALKDVEREQVAKMDREPVRIERISAKKTAAKLRQ